MWFNIPERVEMTVEQQAPGGQQNPAPGEQQQPAPGGQQEQAPGGQQQEAPPWERDGEKFEPEKAWNLITTLRKELDSTKGKTASQQKQIESLKQKSMTPDEKVLAEAEARGRTAASQEWGSRLARSEFVAKAAKRNPEFDTAPALELIDLSKFLGEDGDLDPKAIETAVQRLVPEPSNTPPSFDGGHRESPPKGSNFSDVIRKAAGRG